MSKNHELGIRVLFDDLLKDGYEIQSVDTDPERCPQILAKKESRIVFVVISTTRSMKPPEIEPRIQSRLLEHAKSFNATCYFAPVRLMASGSKTSQGEEGWFVDYRGLKDLASPSRSIKSSCRPANPEL